jgi:membrane fusion protein (multidrug efflux system)
MYAYFNVSETEYLDYETDIKNRAQNQVGLLLANGTPLKYKGKVEVIEVNLIAETGNIALDQDSLILINYLKMVRQVNY